MPRTLQSVPKRQYHLGDQYAEPGTPAWANWQRSLMKSAMKDVHFEARYLVGVIRDMCSGDTPAWHLMSRTDRDGGFRTFEEFVTSPDDLSYGDYAKFKGIATSEPGILNVREYDLLTTAKDGRKENKINGVSDSTCTNENSRTPDKTIKLRALNRAPALIRELYIKGLIALDYARLLGPDPALSGYTARKRQAETALRAIEALPAHSGDDRAYTKAVREAVQRAFTVAQKPTRTTLPKDPAQLIALALKEYGEDYLAALRQALTEDTPHA